eukprot:NODE_793_length_1901_cov_2.901728_g732_i0.p1 GENE.NODE_793_length_1901_cov_2.901728_g732_i0~~NODE_793_length_1901_cov_2.901728_g732_i0.p1  ORF type:complete len:335 (+),score=65.16 NODE_793_length_1901_cov_2.901728_g732_i0:735-1739(+)
MQLTSAVHQPTNQLSLSTSSERLMEMARDLLSQLWSGLVFFEAAVGVDGQLRQFVDANSVAEARSIAEVLQQRLGVDWGVFLMYSVGHAWDLGNRRSVSHETLLRDHRNGIILPQLMKDALVVGKALDGVIRISDAAGAYVDVGYRVLGFIPKEAITLPTEVWLDGDVKSKEIPVRVNVYVKSLTSTREKETLLLSMEPPQQKKVPICVDVIDLDDDSDGAAADSPSRNRAEDAVASALDDVISKTLAKKKQQEASGARKNTLRLEGFRKVRDLVLARKIEFLGEIDPVAVRLIEFLRDSESTAGVEFARKCVADFCMDQLFDSNLKLYPMELS